MPDIPNDLERVKFIREEIKFEHKQIADRLSPFVTAQSFVTTAFAISAQNADHSYSSFVWYAYWVVIPFGFLSALLVLCAISIGVYRLSKLRDMLFKKCDQEVRQSLLPDSSPTAHGVSLFYAFGLPSLMMLIWSIVFIYGMILFGHGSAAKLQEPPANVTQKAAVEEPIKAIEAKQTTEQRNNTMDTKGSIDAP